MKTLGPRPQPWVSLELTDEEREVNVKNRKKIKKKERKREEGKNHEHITP